MYDKNISSTLLIQIHLEKRHNRSIRHLCDEYSTELCENTRDDFILSCTLSTLQVLLWLYNQLTTQNQKEQKLVHN